MRVSTLIAFRHIKSRRHRGFISIITGIAIVGVMLGVAALIITLSILDGFEHTIMDNVVSFTAHMQLFGFQNKLLSSPAEAIQKARSQFPDIVEMAPYISHEAMLRGEKGIEGVMLKGVDPENDISPAKRRLIEGEYSLGMKTEKILPIVIGKRLAEKLSLHIGDDVILFASGGESQSIFQTRVLRFLISGIFETGMGEYDESYVYISLLSAQQLFRIGDEISGFDIKVRNLEDVDRLSLEIPQFMGYPYYARTMFQSYRNLFTWIDLQKKPVPIILGLIIIVATVNIIGTLLMIILERSREIGILRTIGATKKRIQQIFLIQGMFIGIIGTILGNLAALGICWLEMKYHFFSLPSGIYYMANVPIELNIINFAIVSSIALVMCYVSSLLPARVASKLDPIITLRFS